MIWHYCLSALMDLETGHETSYSNITFAASQPSTARSYSNQHSQLRLTTSSPDTAALLLLYATVAGQVMPVTTVPTAACTIRYALRSPVQVGNVMGLVA